GIGDAGQPIEAVVVGVGGDHAARIGSLRDFAKGCVAVGGRPAFWRSRRGKPAETVIDVATCLRALADRPQIIQHVVGVISRKWMGERWCAGRVYAASKGRTGQGGRK